MLDIAYTLMVEERVTATNPLALAARDVEEYLDPEARARRLDQEAMARLQAVQGMPTAGRR